MLILETPLTIILLTTSVGLSVLGLFVTFGLARRLLRIEHLLTRQEARLEAAETSPSVAETSAGGAFEVFLGEVPERRRLTKGEQFAAYRQWRQEKGMNWSTSSE